MPTEKRLQELVINKVDTLETFRAMKEANQIVDDQFYLVEELNDLTLEGYVPVTRTINGKSLSDNITLTAEDVGALPSTTVIPNVPTNVSAFTNDAGYLTADTLPAVVAVWG